MLILVAVLAAGTAETCRAQAVEAGGLTVVEAAAASTFPLVAAQRAAPLYVDASDADVVRVAADAFAKDVERVTGVLPDVREAAAVEAPQAIIVGTVGRSALIDRLARESKIDVSTIRDQWESYLVQHVEDPLPGVTQVLVIAGSDRRGTAYGVLDLSRKIGVSPWYYWADVPVAQHEQLFVDVDTYRQGPPAVKYRGVFLNDTDWGLYRWAKNEHGHLGPETYEKIFELLLRLKANYLWPAMHARVGAFSAHPRNAELADRYAIVMGSAHNEPLLSNVNHWDKEAQGPYNYFTNSEGVRAWWESTLQARGGYENVYTVGMRGISDSGMQGGDSPQEQVKVLEQIFADQRQLLKEYVDTDVTEVPQAMVPYKEVLDLYQMGLTVPDDVTLIWPDDNFGYIRQLSTPGEQARGGGSGVYYHLSYLGNPEPYLWLSTTPPGLIWEEMHKAYDYGARRLWVFNVGDLKPAEINVDYAMQLAWNADRWDSPRAASFLTDWFIEQFGSEHAETMAGIMQAYYQLGYQSKPEYWKTGIFSLMHYGEAEERLARYRRLEEQAEQVYEVLPELQQAAFYQLMLYPVRISALVADMLVSVDRSRLYAEQGRASAGAYSERAREAIRQMHEETDYYNQELAGGKWEGMIMPKGMEPVFSFLDDFPEGVATDPEEVPAMGLVVEGEAAPVGGPVPSPYTDRYTDPHDTSASDLLPEFNRYTRDEHYVDIYNKGTVPFDWTAEASAPWIELSQQSGRVEMEERLFVTIDWDAVPMRDEVTGSIVIEGAGTQDTVRVRVVNPPPLEQTTGFVETHGVVAMEAEHFTRKAEGEDAEWQVVEGLGRTGAGSVSVFPTTVPSLEDAGDIRRRSPRLEYDLTLVTPGEIEVTVYAIPTHPANRERGLRYAVAVDDAEPRIVDLAVDSDEHNPEWQRNVLRNAALATTMHQAEEAGAHTLKIWMVDPGVVIDKIVVDAGGARPSHLGPPESPHTDARETGAGQVESPTYRFDLGAHPASPGYTPVPPAMRYTEERGYGFLEGAQLSAVDADGDASELHDAVTSDAPFYFAVNVPEGNYRVRVTLGAPSAASQTTVKAESRRLMLHDVTTAPEEVATRTFTVNVRNSRIEVGSEVRLKDREIGAFHWDDRLTLEFNGPRPAVAALEITRVDDAVTVFLAGNSTVTDQTREPWAAWGQMLPRFFGREVAVANHAESGETLKAFVGENRLEKLLSQIGEGDYLFIQFAHNDQKPGGAHVEAFDGYQTYLKRFMRDARERGAHPVLVTSMHRRRFDEDGQIVNTLEDYPEAMRQTAQEAGVPLIDLHAMSETFYEALGPERSKKAFVHYPAGTFPGQGEALEDDTHHSTYGAYELARAVVSGIQTHVPGLAQHLRDDVEPFDPAHPDDPAAWSLPRSPRASVTAPEGN